MIIVRLITGHVVKIDNTNYLSASSIVKACENAEIVAIYNYVFNVSQIACIEVE